MSVIVEQNLCGGGACSTCSNDCLVMSTSISRSIENLSFGIYKISDQDPVIVIKRAHLLRDLLPIWQFKMSRINEQNTCLDL